MEDKIIKYALEHPVLFLIIVPIVLYYKGYWRIISTFNGTL